MYKLLYGLEGAVLRVFQSESFVEADTLADTVLNNAAQDLQPDGEHTGKTFIVVLVNKNGTTAYSRQYTVKEDQ